MWIECAREAAAAAAAAAAARELGVDEEDGFMDRFSGMSSSKGEMTGWSVHALELLRIEKPTNNFLLFRRQRVVSGVS